MEYVNAQNVLPEDILKLIQDYVDGQYLYIPRKDGKQKSWGENSGIKSSLLLRNIEIYQKYLQGATVLDLATNYFLSEKTIRRIIGEQKRKCS
ncbi:MAG: CD3324 family protein [Turicibacter sp.]